MALEFKKAIYHLNKDEILFAAFTSRVIPGKANEKPRLIPRNPYVAEDPESFNDQAYLFTEEKGAAAFCNKIKEDKKQIIVSVKLERKHLKTLYFQLYSLGVNTIVFNDRGEAAEVELKDIYQPDDFSKLPKEKAPLINQSLALSIQYFFEELTIAVPMDQRTEEQKKSLMARQEEMVANLLRSEVLLVAQAPGEDKKIAVRILTKNDKDGNPLETVLPVFTDTVELERFTKGQKTPIVRLPFKEVTKFMPPKCNLLLNITGTELTLKREAVEKMIGK